MWRDFGKIARKYLIQRFSF